MWKRPLIFFILAVLVTAAYLSADENPLTLTGVQSMLEQIRVEYAHGPLLVIAMFCGAFILLTGLAIPGSIFLTLLGGAVFGGLAGGVLVNVLGSLGAVISFLIARYFLRDFVTTKFSEEVQRINQKIKENGKLSLFTIRLVPISPFVVINLAAGLTRMRAWDFFWITFLGMLPGNLVYSFAGKRLMEIERVSEILTGPLILLLLLIGLVPWVVKRWMSLSHHAH